MGKYVGVKIVDAVPEKSLVDRDNYPAGSEGYLVTYRDGYQSWCPKQEFEYANRPADGLPFGLALEAAIKGHRITRDLLNGYVVSINGVLEQHKDGGRVSLWLPSMTDLHHCGWEVIQ